MLGLSVRAQVPALGDNVKGDLRLAGSMWANYEGGSPLPSPVAYEPGDQVVFRGRLAGFRIAEVGFQRYRVLLKYEIAAFDFRGIPIGEPRKDIINEPVETEDKEWLPVIEYSFFLPPLAEFGDYELRITVRDEVSQREERFTVRYRVNGKQLPELEQISVINFGFYRRQEDSSAMPAGVYRDGNTVWAKFDLAGYRLEAGNRFHIVCDVEVRDAEGNVLFEHPEALLERASPEYPRRYVPGVFSLQVRPGTKKAEYAVAVIARDLLADTSTERVFPFVVE